MDRDGTQNGFDLNLMKRISESVEIPVIASGGVGSLNDLLDGFTMGNVDATLAASIFHFGKYTVKDAKNFLNSKGVNVRLD